MSQRTAVVVPTLGASPHLEACLSALGVQGEDVLRVVVWQGGSDDEAARRAGAAEQLVRVPRPLGFSAAVNLGLAAAPPAPRVAVVNDDAIVAPGWLHALELALDAEPRAAAAQGVVLTLEPPETTDGWGLAWNRWLQAVQLGHGEPPPPPGAPPVEVFGVSATAALYRTEALAEVARPSPPGSPPGAPTEVFDTRLGSYYEDADLAVRLRAAGYTALSVPAARARHAGSVTGRRRRGRMRRLVYGNRYLVAAELLGRELGHHLPRMLARDVVDAALACKRLDLPEAGAVVAGWCRALRRRRAFVHDGAPLVSPDLLGGPIKGERW